MRLLVDQNVARRVATLLGEAGHDAVHVADRGLSSAGDDDILALAVAESGVVLSEDTDFGALLARSGSQVPSFVLVRSAEPLTPAEQAALLITNLPAFERDLAIGAIVVLARGRVRVRRLPISPPN